jgi:NADPH-dependent glutamate synthase beta subunit-like oxidoreductase
MKLKMMILVLFGLVFYATVVQGQEEVLAAMASLQANVQDEVEPKGRPFPNIRGPKCLNSKIGIVGAGASGVHMAYELKKLGYEDVTILEKNDYIGGKSINLEYRGIKQGITSQLITTEYEDTLIPLLEKFGLLDGNSFRYTDSRVWLENNSDVSKRIEHAMAFVYIF